MEVRKVRVADAAVIADIYNHYVVETTVSFELQPVTAEEMRERIVAISALHPYLVCEDKGGRVVGYCYAHPWKEREAYDKTWETTVYVSPTGLGRGVGRMLMERLVFECRNMGCHALVACITADNERSVDFHASIGFVRVSCFRQVGRKFGRWLDVVDYELLLADAVEKPTSMTPTK